MSSLYGKGGREQSVCVYNQGSRCFALEEVWSRKLGLARSIELYVCLGCYIIRIVKSQFYVVSCGACVCVYVSVW